MNPVPSPSTELFKSLTPDKQEKIYNAAIDEFATGGYRGASMNRLVKAAGISKGSLFQYFRAKSDLFDGIVEIAAKRVKDYLRTVRDETVHMSFLERLDRLIQSGFRFIDDHPKLARIYFHLLQSGEAPFGTDRILDLHRQSTQFLEGLIRQGVGRGELRSDIDVQRAAFLLNALLERLLRAYYTDYLASGPGLYQGDRTELRAWIDATLDLVGNGLGARAVMSETETHR